MCGGRNPPAADEFAESAIFNAGCVCFAHQLVKRTWHGRVPTDSEPKSSSIRDLFL